MNKYSKKKSIWKTTCELHPGPVYATIDYGALLRVNGKFINYNKDLFSEIIYPEGDIPEYTQYVYSGKLQKRPVKGNYFIYAGDTTFMLAFYKRMFDVISDTKNI